jgi:hypothetical protein
MQSDQDLPRAHMEYQPYGWGKTNHHLNEQLHSGDYSTDFTLTILM